MTSLTIDNDILPFLTY